MHQEVVEEECKENETNRKMDDSEYSATTPSHHRKISSSTASLEQFAGRRAQMRRQSAHGVTFGSDASLRQHKSRISSTASFSSLNKFLKRRHPTISHRAPSSTKRAGDENINLQQLSANSNATVIFPPPATSLPSTASISIANIHPSSQTVQVENGSETVLMKGVLHKRRAILKSWTKLYFVVTNNFLRYYKLKGMNGLCSSSLSLTGTSLYSDTLQNAKDGTLGRISVNDRFSLRGEIARQDVIQVESLDDSWKPHRLFCFVIVLRKRSGRKKTKQIQLHSGALKENNVERNRVNSSQSIIENVTEFTDRRRNYSWIPGNGKKHSTKGIPEARVLLYLQASSEQERLKWIQVVQRWIRQESPMSGNDFHANMEEVSGHEILSYLVESNSSRAQDQGNTQHMNYGGLSLAAQAARRIDDEYPVVASLLRDMIECNLADEMVFILDQLLGEMKEGWATNLRYMKKLVAAAGSAKLEVNPDIWINPVKDAYGRIMRLLASVDAARIASGASYTSGLTPPTVRRNVSGSSSQSNHNPSSQARGTGTRSNSETEHSFHRIYRVGRKLGSGSFSIVYIATHRETKKQVAVKCISKSELDEADVDALKQEVEVMATLNHPNLVPLLDYFNEARHYYIVTPLCTGGELFDDLVKRKSYTEEDARCLMKKLACALVYVHNRGIVHRDLKPENILLKTSAPGAEVMIADFGFARFLRTESGNHRPGTACGTPGYVAPEVVRGSSYGAEVDCWSLGVILYILLCGYAPFPGKNHSVILEKVVRGDYRFQSPDWDHISSEARDLVSRLINVDPTKRLTACEILQHPWMNPSDMVALTSTSDVKTRLNQIYSDLSPALTHMRKNHTAWDRPKAVSGLLERISTTAKEKHNFEYFDFDLELDEELILEEKNDGDAEEDLYRTENTETISNLCRIES
ncbi:unnamed protein product [Albugo candida]|uniref:non-specific serine/threonine protein kinase n=1 Tax=Albugo candida TaxID=65357 RepID=A0A024GG87_9STRA|nr:unnamed protein product [Albugo candida]|eukprot:CCI45719.1 unnamed protein product [Albugo candida]